MILLDTSGILALAAEDDRYNRQAVKMLEAAEAAGETLVVHNYILVESAALIHRRISLEAAIVFLKNATSFDVVWVDSDLHRRALEYLAQNGSSKLSFVDAVSFLVMRSQSISSFIGFDKHFTEAGFTQYAT